MGDERALGAGGVEAQNTTGCNYSGVFL